mgnify:CR=1 FL=1
MVQGWIAARRQLCSGEKELEYLLLACPILDRVCYSVMVLSRQAGMTQFSRVEELTCDGGRAQQYFSSLAAGAVRPENLGEVLYELIST